MYDFMARNGCRSSFNKLDCHFQIQWLLFLTFHRNLDLKPSKSQWFLVTWQKWLWTILFPGECVCIGPTNMTINKLQFLRSSSRTIFSKGWTDERCILPRIQPSQTCFWGASSLGKVDTIVLVIRHFVDLVHRGWLGRLKSRSTFDPRICLVTR